MFDSVTKIKYFFEKKMALLMKKNFFASYEFKYTQTDAFLRVFWEISKSLGFILYDLPSCIFWSTSSMHYATYIKCFRAIVVSTFYNLLLHLYLFPIKIPMSYYYFTKGLQTNKKIMVQGYGSLVQVYSKKITSARSILISAYLVNRNKSSSSLFVKII